MSRDDPFLIGLYDRLHETPAQRKFRTIAPIPVGTVFIQHPGMSEGDIRGHFRRMKRLGFTCLKGLMTCPGTTRARLMHMALDEGLIPWWYGEGGWEPIGPELLDRLGIPRDTPVPQVRTHPAFLAYQEKVFRERIERSAGDEVDRSADRETAVPFSTDPELHPGAVPRFVDWLRDTYGSVEALAEAWNMAHAGIAQGQSPWESWEDVARGIPGVNPKEYRHIRDTLRFKADLLLARVRARADRALAREPHEPQRAGGEMGLFLPFAWRATDMEGIAAEMARVGSFYPSIHLAWHFEEADFEVARCVYMQASLAADWLKGGWTATWESTGGPQQLSGGKGWEPEGAARIPGFTVDAGVMSQLMLSYLAGGFRGFGFWCWNGRSAGWEAGEFALLDRTGQPCARTRTVGRIGQAARRLRDELWQARKEPLVGVFTDFDHEAMWAAVSVKGRDRFRHLPVQARIGVGRALIDHNVPWEHVSGRDLRAGLAPRYRVIYLPAVLALDSGLLAILADYARGGGRVVLDVPCAWLDEFGRLLPTGPGSAFEGLFGCSIRDFQYASNVPRAIEGHALEGFVADLGLTRARALASYDGGGPAVAEARCGQGTAVVLGFQAALMCRRPGHAWAEERLVRYALGPHRSPYACQGAIAYRLAAPAADHYFLINDGPATAAGLDTRDMAYRSAADAVSGEALDLERPVPLPAHGGRWLRLEK
ncbi:MAG: beta-galactosidase trimerization domain-containing protein [Candidatus Brocadiia bacterium]